MDKYKIIQQIGQGCFGSAYKVLNRKNNKIYVMKKIAKDLASNGEIQQETKILSNFRNSEHIVKYIESFYSKHSFNIVMEYCEGLTIKSYIDRHKRNNQLINKETIYNFILDICRGIKEIHSKNIIHKDIKPDNLFLTKDLRVKIGDFGISKQLYDSLDYAKTVNGPVLYMPPEYSRQKYNNKIDIWSLGCVIHELCTLEICFRNPQNIMDGRYKRINVNYYGNFLQKLIDVLLNQDYHKRPSAEEIIDFVNKREIPSTMIQNYNHHNDSSNFHFDNDVFRPHSVHNSPNRFDSHNSKSHRHHYGRNSFLPSSFTSNGLDQCGTRGSFNKLSHGLTRSNSFISHNPPILPNLIPPGHRIYEPINPSHLIPPPIFPPPYFNSLSPNIIQPSHHNMPYGQKPGFSRQQPVYKQISCGQGIDQNEYNQIVECCKDAYMNRATPLSEHCVRAIKQRLGGDWFVLQCEIGKSDLYFHLTRVKAGEFIAFSLDNKKFEVCRLQ